MIPKIQTIQVNNNDVSPKRVNVGTRGSYGVTKLNFELSSEWDGSACEVVFHPRRGKPISVVWAGVPIDVPVEIMEHNGISGYVFSGIQRSSYDTDESVKRVSLPGELEVLFTLEDKGGNSKGFTPSMYSQILALIGDLGSLTTDARENLVAAINEAAQSGSGDIDEDTIRDIIMDYLEENPIDAPVMSVNGQTGNVQLDATDVGAVPASELVNAINTALAVAKQSGEFDGNDGNDGVSPTVKVTNITGGHRIAITDVNGTKTVDVMDGQDGKDGQDGQDGKDGVSPVVSVSKIGKVTTITITDATGIHVATILDGADGSGGSGGGGGEDGIGIASIVQTTKSTEDDGINVMTITLTDGSTHTFEVQNGSKGSKGNDGISPMISTSAITGGHKITITDANGTKTVNVMNGTDGDNGADGRGIKTIARTSGNGAAGTTDTYTITYTDNTTSTFNVYNGKNGTNGTSVTITNVTNNTGSGATNTVTFSDGKTLSVKNGTDGKDGEDGTSVTVSKVTESTADGGSNVVTFSDGKTVTVKNGNQGKPGTDGKTPVKGTDYWTAADKASMVSDVLAALPTWNGGSY